VPPIVDAHVHLFGPGYVPERWHDCTAERWAHAVWPPRDATQIRRRIEGGLVDLDGSILMDELDRNGIAAAVCIGLDWGLGLGQEPQVPIETQLEHLGSLQEVHGGRFFALSCVDPRRPGALELFERSVVEWKLKALKLYPPCGFYPYEEICFPFYRKAQALNVPVVFHTAMSAHPMRGRFAQPINIIDVQAAFPDLTFVLAHAGHPFWGEEAITVAARHPRTYLELSNWNERVAHDPDGLARFLLRMRDRVGAHRILFGSDHFGGRRFSGQDSIITPFLAYLRDLPPRARGLGLSISEEEVAMILGENAIRVYGLTV
jgi:predicted TIM-barrel fold metal-dependent hydrolase